MIVRLSISLIFCLVLNMQAQDIQTEIDSSDTSSYQNMLDTPIFQISHIQTLEDSLIQHRNPSVLNRISDSFGNVHYRKGLLATTIIANWGAFYLKRRGDDYYQDYLKAGSKSQIQYNYDKANQFDNYATIALVVSGAALSAYLWLLFNN